MFVRSNNASRPVVAFVAFRPGKGPREASSGRTGDAVGVQSIASSSSSSRSRGRISASRDCDAGIWEGSDGGGDEDEGDDNDGWEKVAGLREVWPKTGPDACHVRRGIGAEERERLSSSVGGSRLWPLGCELDDDVFAFVALLVVVKLGGGVSEMREEALVVGVPAREVEESIRRTAGA